MTQLDADTQTIDGDVYKVHMLDPLVATDLLADLGDILGSPLAALGSGIGGDDQIKALLDGGASEESFGPALERAVSEFFKRFSKGKQREIINTLAKVTFVEKGSGEAPRLDAIFAVHFRGRIGTLYKWLGFALKVQFRDFFSLSAPAIAYAVRKMGLGK